MNNDMSPMIYRGKDLDGMITIDGGSIQGCNVVEGGNVTVNSVVSVVENTKVRNGATLTINEGMAVDLIVEAGGTLKLGKQCVFYHIYCKKGGVVYAHTKDNIFTDEGAVIRIYNPEGSEHPFTTTIVEKEPESVEETGHCECCDAEADSCSHCEHKGELEQIREQERQEKDDSEKSDIDEDEESSEFEEEEYDEKNAFRNYKDETVDGKNRTRLHIVGYCDYEDVASDIVWIDLAYEGREIRLYADNDFDVSFDEDEKFHLFIKNLPRFADVDDYDLVITDIEIDDGLPDAYRLGLEWAEYEDVIVGIELGQIHNTHIYDASDDNTLPEIHLNGELDGEFDMHWHDFSIEITSYGVQYFVEEKLDTRVCELVVEDKSFHIKLRPQRLIGNEKVVKGSEMLEILNNSSLTNLVYADDSVMDKTIPHIEDFIVNGDYRPIKLEPHDQIIKIVGFSSRDPKDFFKSIIISSNNDTYIVKDRMGERTSVYDPMSKRFEIELRPMFMTKDKEIVDVLVVSRQEMVDRLSTSFLKGFVCDDELDNKIEIAEYHVNGVPHRVFISPTKSIRMFVWNPYTEPEAERDV